MTTLTDAVALGGSNEPHHVDAAALTIVKAGDFKAAGVFQ